VIRETVAGDFVGEVDWTTPQLEIEWWDASG
jgi:hypothetical protein